MGLYFDGDTAAIYRKGDSKKTAQYRPWVDIVFSPDEPPSMLMLVDGLFFSLMQGMTTTTTARAVLEAIGSKEPPSALEAIRAAFYSPPSIKQDDGTIDRPFQLHDRKAEDHDPVTVWGLVLALESGLVAPVRRPWGRDMQWSANAADIYEGRRAAPAPQPALI